MKGPFEPYQADSEDATTADVLARLARNQQYAQSPFGKIRSWLDKQGEGLEGASPMNPFSLALQGAQTANRWAGSIPYPEQLQMGDMLAPLGAGALLNPGRVLPRDEAMAKVLNQAADPWGYKAAYPELGVNWEQMLQPAAKTGQMENAPFKAIANDRRLGAVKPKFEGGK